MSPVIGAVRFAVQDRLQLHSSGDAAGPTYRISPSAGEAGPPTETSRPHILIVDDERDIRRVLRALLEDEGYTVEEAADGAEGLAVIRAGSRRLVVLLDYKMPRMNGAEMLQAVMADHLLDGRNAFIFVTANLPMFSPELLRLLATVSIPVVEKPYSISLLLDQIEQAIGRLQASPSNPTS